MFRHIPPFVKILPLVVVGILLWQVAKIAAWITAVGGVVMLVCALVWRKRVVGDIYIAASIVFAAMTMSAIRETPQIEDTTQTRTYEATLTSLPTPRGGWQEFQARLIPLGANEQKPLRALVRIDTALMADVGTVGLLTARPYPMPEGSYGRLMHRRGFSATCYASSKEDWQPSGEHNSLTIEARKAQRSLGEKIDLLGLAPNDGAVSKAMTVGQRSEIGAELRSAYSRSGCAHLLAISGLHVGIVASIVWFLLWPLPLLGRRGHILRNLIAMATMIAYAVITGLSPSVVRATVMFCTLQATLAYGAPRTATNTLSGALAIMLLLNPNNLFDISFQLSAVAVMGIAVGFEPLMAWVRSGSRVLNGLWGMVIVAACSAVATLPLVAYTFGTVSLVGIIISPIVVALAEIVVLGSLVWSLLPIAPLAPIFKAVVGGSVGLQNSIIEAVGAQRWVATEIDIKGWVVVVCYLAVAALTVWSQTKKESKEWRLRA